MEELARVEEIGRKIERGTPLTTAEKRIYAYSPLGTGGGCRCKPTG